MQKQEQKKKEDKMLFFWLSLLFGTFFFDENISYFFKTSIYDYIYSFDCFYFRYWEISHDQQFLEMFLDCNEDEVYFEPVKSEEEVIKVLNDITIDEALTGIASELKKEFKQSIDNADPILESKEMFENFFKRWEKN